MFFDQHVLASMKSEETSLLDKIYVKNVSVLYTNSDDVRCCHKVLLNVLNKYFINIWLSNAMAKFKRSVLTFMPNENIVHQPVSNANESLSDGDTNQLFGY